jgi:hypothetical protein
MVPAFFTSTAFVARPALLTMPAFEAALAATAVWDQLKTRRSPDRLTPPAAAAVGISAAPAVAATAPTATASSPIVAALLVTE